LDGETGEVFECRLTPDYGEIRERIGSLPGPVAAVYEAGPTGFGLARSLLSAGIDCVVAAPSKLQRPSGDRVKTDARDARHLARLLHLNEIAEVTVPSVEQEAARDLVRAREDCRGDLMAVRHRLSKLLLRHGIVYSGGQAWSKKHELWLRTHRFQTPGLQLAYDAAFDAMLATVDRRDRLDEAISERWWSVAFGDVLVVEFAFGFDSAGKVFGSGASAPGHHQPAAVAERHGRFLSRSPQGGGGLTRGGE
jgi:transposase